MATTHYFLSLWISLLTQHKSTNIYLFVLCIDRCFDFTFIYLVCVVCRWWWWVWRSEVNLQDQVLSPILRILDIELKSSDFGGNNLYLQSHFSSPPFFPFRDWHLLSMYVRGGCTSYDRNVGVRDGFVVAVLSYLSVTSRNESRVSGSQWQAFYLLKPLAVETSSQLLDQILRPSASTSRGHPSQVSSTMTSK